jgi:hypothetical protein
MIFSAAVWSLLWGYWAGLRFWSVRDALRTGKIKTGFSMGRWVYRSTDPGEFALVMRWRVLGGMLWAAIALLPVFAVGPLLQAR